MQGAETELRLAQTRLSRPSKPFGGFRVVLRNAFAFGIGGGEVVLGLWEILFGCALIPKESKLVVLCYAFAALIQDAEIELGIGDSLFRGALEPLGGFGRIFVANPARQIEHTKIVLRFGIARLCLLGDVPDDIG